MSTRGFIALTAVLMLAALSLALSVTGSVQLFLLRDGIADERSYRAALANGWSCAQLAFARLQSYPERFTESTTVIHPSSSEVCTVIEAGTTETGAGALVTGQSRNSYVTLYITASRASSTAPLRLATWEIR